MSEDTKDVDMALILEGRIKERVNDVLLPMVERTVVNIVGKEIYRCFNEEKEKMMMEIAVQLGKIIKEADSRDRRPLWESTPEEFGLNAEDLNRSMMGKLDRYDEDGQKI